MPVTTRSQSLNNKQSPVNKHPSDLYNERKQSFITNMKKVFEIWGNAKTTKDKIICATNVFIMINKDFEYLFTASKTCDTNSNIWNKFAVTTYIKITENRLEHMFANGWPAIDKTIVNKLMQELCICEKLINPIILQLRPESMNSDKYREDLVLAQAVLKSGAKARATKASVEPKQRTSPRKNIKRIDYSQFY